MRRKHSIDLPKLLPKEASAMNKAKWMLGAAALVVGTLVVTGTIDQSSAEQPPAVPSNAGAEHKKALDTKEGKVASKIKLDVPGPVEHYVWYHRGDVDEVWQNKETGEWRIEKTLADGTSSTGIYKDGYYYKIGYDQNGQVMEALKIPQASSYTGKDSSFQAMKMEIKDLTDAGVTDYDGVEVQVLTKETGKEVKESHKYYVDKKYNLPLRKEVTVNGQSYVETWGYSYEQNDPKLFEIPANVTFKLQQPADIPQDGKTK
jgi:hypothetical protein